MNKKLNKLHKRVWRLVHKNNQYDFDELLLRNKTVIIHYQNLKVLTTELNKVEHWLVPAFMNDIFGQEICHRKPAIRLYLSPFPRFIYMGNLIWNLLSKNLKVSENVNLYNQSFIN